MITFIIGNGFDLNLGMNTRYSDIYDSYILTPSKNDTISNFKFMINGNYKTWADFEIAMGREAYKFASEDEYIMCIRDFREHIVQYLTNEQTNILETLYAANNISIIADEMESSIERFYKGLTPNISNIIDKSVSSYSSINFITFNYTTILDRIIEDTNIYHSTPVRSINKPIHIHGNLFNDVVLGVNDISQIDSIFKITHKTQRSFIKPKFNDSYDKTRVESALNAIRESNIICTYGWSWGESDQMWIHALQEWLLTDENSHLICYKYDETFYPPYNWDIKLDREEELKNELLDYLDFPNADRERVYNNIHFPISYSIFDFINKVNDSHNQPSKITFNINSIK